MSKPDSIVAVNVAICEALGLAADDVKAISIRVCAAKVPTVEIEYSATYLMRHPELMDALARFELVEVMQPA